MIEYLYTREAKKCLQKFGYKEFTALQDKAFQKCGYLGGARECIIGQTSSGKTMIPLICYHEACRNGTSGAKLLYLIPYRALATQKKHDLEKLFPNQCIIVSTSEYCRDDASLLHAECDIAIAIYEKVYLQEVKSPGILKQYSHIVFDEMGIIGHNERGLKVDFIFHQACNLKKINIYMLVSPYYNWDYYIEHYKFHKVYSNIRPIDVVKEIIKIDTTNETSEEDIQSQIFEKTTELCMMHWKQNEKILVFVNNRKKVQELSRFIYMSFVNENLLPKLNDAEFNKKCREYYLSQLDISEFDLVGIMSNRDYVSFHFGITFHNASLPEEMREFVEKEFLGSSGNIRIVVSTETLAYGLNSNVDVVIVADMFKMSNFLTGNEYGNYIGRAGRLGCNDKGYAYTLLKNKDRKKWDSLNLDFHNPPYINSSYGDNLLRDKGNVIFHLLNYFNTAEGISKLELLNQVKDYPFQGKEYITIDVLEPYINQLLHRGLIEYFEDDEEEVKYILTARGKFVSGFVISAESYDCLYTITAEIINNKHLFIFDVLYSLCKCPDVNEKFKNYIVYPEKSSEYKKILRAMNKVIKMIQTDEEISVRLLKEINGLLNKIKKIVNKNSSMKIFLFPQDIRNLKYIQIAMILYLWSNSYSVNYIENLFKNVSYEKIKTIGEKAKYIIDIMIYNNTLSGGYEYTNSLKYVGISLYYGISINKILKKYNKFIIEPIEGRQLRSIGIYLNLLNSANNQEKKLDSLRKDVTKFKDEYQTILEGNIL